MPRIPRPPVSYLLERKENKEMERELSSHFIETQNKSLNRPVHRDLPCDKHSYQPNLFLSRAPKFPNEDESRMARVRDTRRRRTTDTGIHDERIDDGTEEKWRLPPSSATTATCPRLRNSPPEREPRKRGVPRRSLPSDSHATI